MNKQLKYTPHVHSVNVLVLLDRVAVCTAKVAYSHRPFPLTICRSVCLSAQCIVEERQIQCGCRLAW